MKNFIYIKSLLLRNSSLKQIVFKNTFWLTIGIGISKLLSTVLLIYVARTLGATEYGKFTFALAFISLFIVYSDLGLSPIVNREFAREEKKREFHAILALKLLLSGGVLLLILSSSLFITPDPTIRNIIRILAFYAIINDFIGILNAFFQARQRMEYQAWSDIFQAFLITTSGFFVIINFPTVVNLSYAYLLTATLTLTLIVSFFHLKVFPLQLLWKPSIWKKFLSMSWPLALTSLFGTMNNNISSVIMGYLNQITETGWYNGAYRIAWTAFIFVGLVTVSVYPILSKAFKESAEKLQTIWDYEMELMIILAIPLVTGGITLSQRIIDSIYGSDFAPSIFTFKLLIIMAGVILLYITFKDILIITHQEIKVFWAILGGAISSVVLSLTLIPIYSLYGAASASVMTHVVIFFLLLKFTITNTSIKPFKSKFLFTLVGAIISSIVMYGIISLPAIYQLPVFLSILIGAGVYFACFFLYRKFTGAFLKVSAL